MASRNYPVVVYPLSKEDGGGFCAVAPDLPGCMGDGETPEAAVADVYRAIDEWIDEAHRLKRDIPLPGSYAAERRKERDTLVTVLQRQEKVLRAQDKLLNEQLASAKRDIESLASDVARLLEHYTASERWAVEGFPVQLVMGKRKAHNLTH